VKISVGGNINGSIGSFSLYSSVDMLIGPIVGRYATEHFGFKNSYKILSFISLIALILSFFISKAKKQNQKEEQKNTSGFNDLIVI